MGVKWEEKGLDTSSEAAASLAGFCKDGMRDGTHLPKRLSPSFSPLATLYTEGWDSLLNICRTLTGRNGGV